MAMAMAMAMARAIANQTDRIAYTFGYLHP